jgi:hypothetical protein
MYYYDDVYGSNGPSADLYGGKKSGAAKRKARKASANAKSSAKVDVQPAGKRNRRSGSAKKARRAKAAATAAKVASKSPKKAAAPTPKKDRRFTPVSPRCSRLKARISDKPMTPRQRARRQRLTHLSHRCDKRELFLEDNQDALLAAVRAVKKAKESDEKDTPANKKIVSKNSAFVLRVKRTAARLGREQSKLRAFVKQNNGFKGVDTVRTASGFTIHRSDVGKNLREKHGRFYVNLRRPTNAKFMAWREAVREVLEQRGKQSHPTKGGALLAKKDGDEHEQRHWQEIHDVYAELVNSKQIAEQVEAYNSSVDDHNRDLRQKSYDNAQKADRAEQEALRKAEADRKADKEARAKARADKRAKKAARASAKKEKAKERRASSKTKRVASKADRSKAKVARAAPAPRRSSKAARAAEGTKHARAAASALVGLAKVGQ